MTGNGYSDELVPVSVHGVLRDPNTDTRIVILRDDFNQDSLAIWIGMTEGDAISHAMTTSPTPRPLTHDLIRNLMEHLSLTVTRVVITDVKNNTYYARIYFGAKGTDKTVDARPSDAIALALRTRSPIFAARSVLQQQGKGNLDQWMERFGVKDPKQPEAS
jgi:bifunctional DNase/RNase